MEMFGFIFGFLITFLTVSCSNDIVKPDNFSYKGGALHNQPSIDILPEENIYPFSNITDTVLDNKLTSNIQKIISDQEITGISITMLIPEKGLWKLDTGYISKNTKAVVDSSTVFYWASVSKLITSTVIHQLIEENKLDLRMIR